ncbi:MAG: RDD family protein [Candidatus Cyclobacteriaceae bacterium M2_1C_046]
MGLDDNLYFAKSEQRIINVIVDMIVIFILWFILSLITIITGLEQFYIDKAGEQIPIISMIIILPTFWAYYIFSEYIFQRTLGKMLTKSKVVTLNGDKPTFKQILIRTLSRNIPFEYLSYLITVKGIHDKLSNTRVIKI